MPEGRVLFYLGSSKAVCRVADFAILSIISLQYVMELSPKKIHAPPIILPDWSLVT